jgi:hypothetical protein
MPGARPATAPVKFFQRKPRLRGFEFSEKGEKQAKLALKIHMKQTQIGYAEHLPSLATIKTC